MNHEGPIMLPGKSHLELPFRPFTLDEVQAITGCPAAVLDQWAGLDGDKPLPLQYGCGASGLNWMQTFAAFVGLKYLHEGATTRRAYALVLYVGGMAQGQMEHDITQGLSFPVPAYLFPPGERPPGGGVMVEPPHFPLGQRLNLKVLYEEFKERVAKVFPESPPKTVREG